MWKVLQISFYAFYRVWMLFTLNSIRFPAIFPAIFFSLALDSHPVVYFISWKISHGIEKRRQIHQFGRVWEIGIHTFSKVWVLFFHQILILGNTSLNAKWMTFPSISNSTIKCSKIYPGSSQVVCLQYYFLYLLQNLLIHLNNKRKSLIK